jgi:hypothetical protein
VCCDVVFSKVDVVVEGSRESLVLEFVWTHNL